MALPVYGQNHTANSFVVKIDVKHLRLGIIERLIDIRIRNDLAVFGHTEVFYDSDSENVFDIFLEILKILPRNRLKSQIHT